MAEQGDQDWPPEVVTPLDVRTPHMLHLGEAYPYIPRMIPGDVRMITPTQLGAVISLGTTAAEAAYLLGLGERPKQDLIEAFTRREPCC